MKLLALLALFVIAWGGRLRGAEAEARPPLFNARLTAGGEARFVLVSPSSGNVSAWLRLGERFEGYVLRAFDPRAEALELERGGVRVRVFLVPDAITVSAVDESPAALAEAEATVEQRRFERMIDKALAGAIAGQTKRVDALVARVLTRDAPLEETGALRAKLTEALRTALATPEVKEAVARSYREVFSEEEVRAVAAFFDAPFAQRLAEEGAEESAPEEVAARAAFRAMALGRKMEERRNELQRKIDAVVAARAEAEMERLREMAKDEAGEGR